MLKQLKAKIAKYNQILPLADYLIPLVEDKKEVKIADIGSGPFPITGQTLEGVKVEITHADQQDFGYFWEKYKTTPLFKTEVENMEKLSYPDGYFDITHCVNALDHTKDALSALKELIRITKKGGWIYIECALIQKTTRGHRHFWDALEDGTFTDGETTFNLKDFGFSVEHIINGDSRPHQLIIAKYTKL